MNGKNHNGRNVLHVWRLSIVLFGCAVGLVSVPSVAVAQADLQDVVDAVDEATELLYSLNTRIGFTADGPNRFSLEDELDRLDVHKQYEVLYWTNNVDWRTKLVPGIRQDLYNWLYPYALQTGNSSPTMGIAPDDQWTFLWWGLGDHDNAFAERLTSHVEFENLVFGQNVDGSLWNFPGEDLFDAAFNWRIAQMNLDEYGIMFWNIWQAEAWRRQLYALGAVTNSFESFTNSAVIASMQGILGTPDEMGYGVSNVVQSFEELTTTNEGPSVISMIGETFRLPTVSPTFYGTNELEETVKEISPSLNLVTNLQSGLYSSIQIAPPENLGGLNFQARFQGIPQMDRVEVDLNGGLADQSLQRVKRFVHLLLGFAFLVFQIVESVRTLFYIMRLDDGQSRSASI